MLLEFLSFLNSFFFLPTFFLIVGNLIYSSDWSLLNPFTKMFFQTSSLIGSVTIINIGASRWRQMNVM